MWNLLRRRERRWYIGLNCANGIWYAFRSSTVPTRETYGQEYAAVRGPYPHQTAALYAAIHRGKYDELEIFSQHPMDPLCQEDRTGKN